MLDLRLRVERRSAVIRSGVFASNCHLRFEPDYDLSADEVLTSLSTAAGQGNARAILMAGSGLSLRRSRAGELDDAT